ncbi:MAG: amidohydrolase [Oscillospiraceae bacterium]|jgi:aminocarboxymuconate-semialdehyde decarboxylase|nr:amidohydrolase [Oscillospiraceae bacterium]
MNIDAHHHFMPEPVIRYIQNHSEEMGADVIEEKGARFLATASGARVPITPGACDNEARLEQMKQMRLDKAVLSIGPNCFFYWVDTAHALNAARLANDWAARSVQDYPGYFYGVATIPMQDAAAALKELRRAREELNLRAVEISPVIMDKHLDDESFFPIYEYCADKGVLLCLHPYVSEDRPEYRRYYNANLTGAPLQTAAGLNHLLFGGVFERFPALNVLAAHGGGFFPYQLGRMMHGYKVRQEPKARGAKSPELYLKRLYFDTITHWTPSLQFLIDTFGADHVMLGTDYPYDMGDFAPADSLDRLRLTAGQRDMITHLNAQRLFG